MSTTTRLLFVIGLMGMINATECWAEVEYVSAPRLKAFQTWEKSQDCSVLRQVARDTQKRIGNGRDSLRFEQTTVRETRERLEDCARAQGLGGRRSEDNEAALAEICPAQYSEWLSPMYRAQMYEEDIARESKDLGTLTEQLRSACPRLPAKMGGLF